MFLLAYFIANNLELYLYKLLILRMLCCCCLCCYAVMLFVMLLSRKLLVISFIIFVVLYRQAYSMFDIEGLSADVVRTTDLCAELDLYYSSWC